MIKARQREFFDKSVKADPGILQSVSNRVKPLIEFERENHPVGWQTFFVLVVTATAPRISARQSFKLKFLRFRRQIAFG